MSHCSRKGCCFRLARQSAPANARFLGYQRGYRPRIPAQPGAFWCAVVRGPVVKSSFPCASKSKTGTWPVWCYVSLWFCCGLVGHGCLASPYSGAGISARCGVLLGEIPATKQKPGAVAGLVVGCASWLKTEPCAYFPAPKARTTPASSLDSASVSRGVRVVTLVARFGAMFSAEFAPFSNSSLWRKEKG